MMRGRVTSVKVRKTSCYATSVTHLYSGFFFHNAHIPNTVYFQFSVCELSDFWLIYSPSAAFTVL